MENHRDVVVIGAGAAGLSAALVLTRARANVLVVEDGTPRNAQAAHMHGFVSRDGVDPAEFLEIGRREVVGYGAEFVHARVVDARSHADGGFVVTLDSGVMMTTRAVLDATGLTDELPDIAGVRELWGSAVHHCPHCHGHEVADRNLVVIGGQAPAMTLHQAALLRRYSDRVTLCPHDMDIQENERGRLEAFGVRIKDGTVARLRGDQGRLIGIELVDGTMVECEAAFIAPQPRPNDAILHALGCATVPDTGWVAVEGPGATSVPGVWACGNVVNPRAQVITAAGEASAAAIAITSWLLETDIEAAVERADTSTPRGRS
ncbi:NAD(P)/FAD-dependent oxidoreductase [Nocardioides sp. LHD-245]|uniref:NAD(P)/FAD-dependent oxidoreductase n=1 Tax=Nocardioides sp. LHD-245 TaxID=3051387 RepID=UPI0027E0D8E2|nr:NAD(P)/FAD-dependent oxidoreductase [Nocardioides sp. LHD-245]